MDLKSSDRPPAPVWSIADKRHGHCFLSSKRYTSPSFRFATITTYTFSSSAR